MGLFIDLFWTFDKEYWHARFIRKKKSCACDSSIMRDHNMDITKIKLLQAKVKWKQLTVQKITKQTHTIHTHARTHTVTQFYLFYFIYIVREGRCVNK